jgi:predicted CxxxxCH...CXXCH cytochrome family protein
VVDVDFSGYNAQSGTASYDAGSGTCSKVSCHGGQNTPDWFSGSINLNTQCNECHSMGSEYNSFSSGKHKKHVQDKGHPCRECHDTSKLQAVHFNDLGTPQMNQAAQTILDELNYNGESCLFTCHYQNDDKEHDEGKKW